MGKTRRKSWREKLADSRDLPRLIDIDARMSQRWGTGTCVIPAPLEVDALMRKVPKGKLTTINEIRAALARSHGATGPASAVPLPREYLPVWLPVQPKKQRRRV